MWPYSYDTCDLGTFPNQTTANNLPEASTTGGRGGGPLSFMPGQRLSACTCPGSDHPGPSVTDGRGVPEIDILEAQIDVAVFQGQVSQSFQCAPFNYQYQFDNSTPATTIFDSTQTSLNSYQGGVYQQALSAVTFTQSQNYNGQGYGSYGYEWFFDQNDRSNGYITWYSDGVPSWSINQEAVGPDSTAQIGQRLIPEEPMVSLILFILSTSLTIFQYLILNLGLSPGFQKQDFKNLQFPSKMYVDHVRVYQREGTKSGLTCDPPSHPTANYIQEYVEQCSFLAWQRSYSSITDI